MRYSYREKATKEQLMDFYNDGIQIKAIAQKLGYSTRTILLWNKGYGIGKKEIGYRREGICQVCGDGFTYRRGTPRVYCSQECYHKILKNGNGSHKRIAGGNGLTRQTYLARAWRVFKAHQPYIEKKRGWVMHHLDGDITNNEAGNLFIFYGHGAHMKHHHLVRKGVVVELRDIIDGIYIK